MRRQSVLLGRAGAVAAMVGCAMALLGTYTMAWVHVRVGHRAVGWSVVGVTLHQLSALRLGNSWYAIACSVMALGAVVLGAGGVGATGVVQVRWARWWSPAAMAIGAAVIGYAALRTGLPAWSSARFEEVHSIPLGFSRGPGEVVCLLGAGLGLVALVCAFVAAVEMHPDAGQASQRERGVLAAHE